MRRDYGQFCPVAQAAEILTERWTPLILRELLAGSTRFNDIRRGVAQMSPSLLSKRLRRLRETGVIERVPAGGGRAAHYRLTPAGKELRPFVEQLGTWGARWVEHAVSEHNLDLGLLMWDIRRHLNRAVLCRRGRSVVEFRFADGPDGKQRWWLVADRDETELCLTDPGLEVDMLVETDVRTLIRVWIGDLPLARATQDRRIRTSGDPDLQAQFPEWLRESPFAAARRDRQA